MKDVIYVYGAGGFGREVVDLIRDCYRVSEVELSEFVRFIDADESLIGKRLSGIRVISPSDFDPSQGKIALAVGDPGIREKIVQSLPKDTSFVTLIHPNVVIGRNTSIGEGAIICAGNVITCDIKIGKFAQLNLNGTIGHDCIIGDYFTTAPGVNISGLMTIENRVYFGTQSATRQGIKITNDVVIGMAACVVKDIQESGTYVGTPAKRLMK